MRQAGCGGRSQDKLGIMPQMQVKLQTGRTMELRQSRIDLSMLSSVGVQAGMHIGARESPVLMVRTDLLGDSQAVVSDEESRLTNLLLLQLDLQNIGMMGIRQAGYICLLDPFLVPTGVDIVVEFFPVVLVTADLIGDR